MMLQKKLLALATTALCAAGLALPASAAPLKGKPRRKTVLEERFAPGASERLASREVEARAARQGVGHNHVLR